MDVCVGFRPLGSLVTLKRGIQSPGEGRICDDFGGPLSADIARVFWIAP